MIYGILSHRNKSINWRDYSEGKRKTGHGKKGAVPIIGGVLGTLGDLLNPLDVISGDLAGPEDDMLSPQESMPELPGQQGSSSGCPTGGLAPTADPEIIDLGFQPNLGF